MAWSDNIAVFASSVDDAAVALSTIALHLEHKHFRIKDGAQDFVPSCSRRLAWSDVQSGPFTFLVVSETKCLGYYIASTGDTTRSKSSMLGSMRGRLSRLGIRFMTSAQCVKARWWKSQFRGAISFFAPFVGLNSLVFGQFCLVTNAAVRKVGNPHHRNNSSTVFN